MKKTINLEQLNLILDSLYNRGHFDELYVRVNRLFLTECIWKEAIEHKNKSNSSSNNIDLEYLRYILDYYDEEDYFDSRAFCLIDDEEELKESFENFKKDFNELMKFQNLIFEYKFVHEKIWNTLYETRKNFSESEENKIKYDLYYRFIQNLPKEIRPYNCYWIQKEHKLIKYIEKEIENLIE